MSNRFGENISWISEGDTLKLGGRGIIKKPPVPEKQWKRIEISEGILGIDAYAFAGFVNLKEVELPKSMMTIGEYAFADCWNLSKIGPLPSLNFIEKNAFEHSGCHTLTKALEEAGPTLVPYNYKIYSTFGDVRLNSEQKSILYKPNLYEQLASLNYAVTSRPELGEVDSCEEIIFENLYKIVLDGNYTIGVVLKDKATKELTWLFVNKDEWLPYPGRKGSWLRLELRKKQNPGI